mmetsp:Transcript_47288/g.111332  ORF Transcript_47288/g.111332 Transcript_47288/m.111332 type:complete len:117 (-) Transcript_47288:151-501(-)
MRNYLFPEKFAKYATPENIAAYALSPDESERVMDEFRRRRALDKRFNLLKLKGTTITIQRLPFEDKLAEPMTEEDVLQELRKARIIRGSDVTFSQFTPLASFGEHQVFLQFKGSEE